MRQWIEQPVGTRVCGQIAVAVVTGITLEQAIRIIRKKGGTTTKDLAFALRFMGYKCPTRCMKISRPPLAIGHLTNPRRKSGWHWIVVDGDKIFDGRNGNDRGQVAWPKDWKITSYLPITQA
jgi:hypothetical protein